METNSESIGDQVQPLMELPFWIEATGGVFDLVAILIVVLIAHYLSRRKVQGGLSMLLCVYGSILFSLIPFALTGSELGESSAVIAWSASVLVPSMLSVLAAIHGLRAVAALSNHENA